MLTAELFFSGKQIVFDFRFFSSLKKSGLYVYWLPDYLNN